MARKNKETDLTYDTEAIRRKDQITIVCLYNAAIDCNMRDMGDEWFCRHCGWNPMEIDRRKKEKDDAFRVVDE